MDPKAALEEKVKPKLEDTFGKAVAMLIVMSATNSSGASVVSLDETDYRRLCGAICTDPRVVNMWGQAGAQAQQLEWERLV